MREYLKCKALPLSRFIYSFSLQIKSKVDFQHFHFRHLVQLSMVLSILLLTWHITLEQWSHFVLWWPFLSTSLLLEFFVSIFVGYLLSELPILIAIIIKKYFHIHLFVIWHAFHYTVVSWQCNNICVLWQLLGVELRFCSFPIDGLSDNHRCYEINFYCQHNSILD